jgi:hypothetical protein
MLKYLQFIKELGFLLIQLILYFLAILIETPLKPLLQILLRLHSGDLHISKLSNIPGNNIPAVLLALFDPLIDKTVDNPVVDTACAIFCDTDVKL